MTPLKVAQLTVTTWQRTKFFAKLFVGGNFSFFGAGSV